MSHFDRFTSTLDEPEKQPSKVGSRLADFGDRIARAFTVTDRRSFFPPESGGIEPPYGEDTESPYGEDTEQPWERIASRFPSALEGYDRAAVDLHLSELERELAQLRTSPPQDTAVAAEINKIGEQTSTILMTAHEQAQQITRRAKSQADHCIAEAASRAMAMTQQSEQRLRQLDAETDAIWSERAQLIEDVRGVASALTTLAEESARRFPAEPVRPPVPTDPVGGATDPAPVPVPTDPLAGATDPEPVTPSAPEQPLMMVPAPVPTSGPGPVPETRQSQPPLIGSQAPSTAAAQAQTAVIHHVDEPERDLEDC